MFTKRVVYINDDPNGRDFGKRKEPTSSMQGLSTSVYLPQINSRIIRSLRSRKRSKGTSSSSPNQDNEFLMWRRQSYRQSATPAILKLHCAFPYSYSTDPESKGIAKVRE